MKILLLGSGGREHAFAWKLTQSPKCERLYIAPGNAGTSQCGENVAMQVNDFAAIEAFCIDKKIDMVIVGPEDPLVKGIVNHFRENDALKNIPVVGPDAEGAQLEGSKAFAKKFMMDMNIPTAAYREFSKDDLQAGLDYIATQTPPIVLKADGLAAGKGVVISPTIEEAQTEFKEMLSGKFGAASETIVIEQFLKGIEFSVFVLTDSKEYKILPVAKDYKRIGEGDTGLNTGGMGAISPPPFVDQKMMDKVESRIIKPTIEGLKKRNIDYKGFIFIGLIEVDGEPYVIEYNCRMGDPETEVVLPRLKNDMVELMASLFDESLKSIPIKIDPRTAATVMLVSGGYPEAYEKGKKITGIEAIQSNLVFHAGTKETEARIVTNGGRVIALTSFGESLHEAVGLSLISATKIEFEEKYYRRDIGFEFK